jgi:CheY-like chemotaxis protein
MAVVAVADADRTAGRRLADDLGDLGYPVAHATRGQEVLGLAASGRLLAAVVDVSLEDMTGPVLLAQLRRMLPAVPVIVTTAEHGPDVERLARALGIVYYAPKPVWPDRLWAVLRHVLGPPAGGGGPSQGGGSGRGGSHLSPPRRAGGPRRPVAARGHLRES